MTTVSETQYYIAGLEKRLSEADSRQSDYITTFAILRDRLREQTEQIRDLKADLDTERKEVHKLVSIIGTIYQITGPIEDGDEIESAKQLRKKYDDLINRRWDSAKPY